MRGLFITGTDTGVGKTVVTALAARELRQQGVRTGCYKPVCSGSEMGADGSFRWSDVETLSSALENSFPSDRICPQRFHAPLAPPSAAAAEDREVDAPLLRRGVTWWNDRVDVLLVEGVGGLLCPIATNETVADVASDLGFPLLVISPLILGTINHTLLTIDAAQHRSLHVSGIVFNNVENASDELQMSTVSEIAARSDVPLLGVIPYNRQDRLQPLDEGSLRGWKELSGEPRYSFASRSGVVD